MTWYGPREFQVSIADPSNLRRSTRELFQGALEKYSTMLYDWVQAEINELNHRLSLSNLFFFRLALMLSFVFFRKIIFFVLQSFECFFPKSSSLVMFFRYIIFLLLFNFFEFLK